eukprot:CAMPEP_0202921140 /NCGR_PEP_ID=MMETSP1392-20130828/77235_1 /ASSEMBLY_ACC=CAM_ASM_000868 /TAXON_ID=225041 /ORGANISM="Chlamydomonas chlamydogama, Strain SAG 11-48b" /LENGTH=373 /DNA_ID=CAMNT_0049614687 /DNA_START=173 /DNA_END=1294 /DNA_ORIENTATION=-
MAALQTDDIHKLSLTEHDDHEEDQGGNGGFLFDSPEHKEQLKNQRAQLWQWLKSVGSNMFREGINLTKVSLPVCLFEARSFLERITTNWEYQDLLVAASTCADPVERMKYVVAFAIGGLSRQISFHKPFNPILGETYQSVFPNGVEVYCEQTSHHPPVSSWQVVDPKGKFTFYGNANWTAGIKGNSVKGRQTGVNCVHFSKDDATITYELPGLTVKGVLWGQRSIKYGGEMKFRDVKNGLECDVQVDPQPQQGWVSSWFRSKKSAGYKPDLIRGTLKKGDTVLDTCTGNWLHFLEWEHGLDKGRTKRIWDIRHTPFSVAKPVDNPLSSDARHRNDVVFLKAGDQPKAQEWKHILEETQRKDRKLRKEGGGYEH